MNNYVISGLFADLLKKCSNWFLYIFIPANAKYSSRVMRKRANQISILQFIDKVNLVYNYSELSAIVAKGIKEKYGLTPYQVINSMYLDGVTAVSGVGKIVNKGDSVYYKDGQRYEGTIFWDSDSGKYLDDKGEMIGVKTDTLKVLNESGNSEDFWKNMNNIVVLIGNLFKSIGLKFDNDSKQNTPSPADWNTNYNYKSESNIGTYLPVIVGGVLLYYLFNQAKKEK